MPSSSNAQASQVFTEADYARLFELSLDLLVVAGLDGYFKKVNPAWVQTFGWTEAELLSRPVADFMHPDDRERTLQARERLAHGVPLRGLENRYRCKNGTYRWLSWQSSVVLAEQKVFAVAHDITERRRLDQQRLELSKVEATGILAAGIAHDFNNLLGALLLNIELVGLAGATTPEQNACLQQARQAALSAETLTHRLLTFARSGSPARRLLDVKALLPQWVERAVSGTPVRAECVIDSKLWRIDADEMRLGEVIHSIAANACEAMPGGGRITLQAANVPADTEDAPSAPGAHIRITITDTGPGIAPEVLPNVFAPYFTTKPRGAQKGVGLGLSICRTIVQEHGGTLTLESVPGRGTTAILHLPARPTREESAAPFAPTAARILVMDDDDAFRGVLAQAVRQLGHEVALAANGAAAIAQFEQAATAGRPFDAALLALVVRDGLGAADTLAGLRRRQPGFRAAVMSGFEQDERFRDFERHGFTAALRKPFTTETLRAAVADLLRRRG